MIAAVRPITRPHPATDRGLRALLFDVDGTLADTEETHRQAFNLAFLRLELGWEWGRELYRLALASLGLPAAACVAFEDSANGLRAAKAAGLFTVITPTLWSESQDFTGADLLLSSLGDPQQPLAAAERERIGGPWLGLAQLEALHARRLRVAEPQEN